MSNLKRQPTEDNPAPSGTLVIEHAVGEGAPALRIFEEARREIADASTVEQVNRIVALATGLAAAARQATDRDLEAEAAILKMEAERKLGQLMKAQAETIGLNKGGRPKTGFSENPVSEKATYAEAGINKNTAHRARQAAVMPEAEFKKAAEAKRAAVLTRSKKTKTGAAKTIKDAGGNPPAPTAAKGKSWNSRRVDTYVDQFRHGLTCLKRDAPSNDFSRLCAALRDVIDDIEGAAR